MQPGLSNEGEESKYQLGAAFLKSKPWNPFIASVLVEGRRWFWKSAKCSLDFKTQQVQGECARQWPKWAPIPAILCLPSSWVIYHLETMEQMDTTLVKEGNENPLQEKREKRKERTSTTPLGRSKNSCSILSQCHRSGAWLSPIPRITQLKTGLLEIFVCWSL